MTTERKQLEQEFQDLINQRNLITKEIDKIWRLSENPKTYDSKLYDKQGDLIKERYRLNDLIDKNAQERRDKGYITIIL